MATPTFDESGPAPGPPPAPGALPWRVRTAFLGLAGLILIADQAMKWWILERLRLHEIGHVEVSPVMDLTMVWNYGVSFGVLRADSDFGRWALVGMTGTIALVFAIWLARAARGLTAAALALVIGGAVGNLIDRVRFGAVADFLNARDIGFPWVFNVADAAITIGALLLALDLFGNPEPKPAGKSPPPPA